MIWMTEQILDPGVKVVDGSVIVNSVQCIYQTEAVQLWEIDCRTKYAELLFTGSGPKECDIALHVNENSRYINEALSDSATMIIWSFPDDNWHVYGVSGGRYTFQITLFDHTKRKGYEIPDIAT